MSASAGARVRRPGAAQGATLVAMGFAPALAVLSLPPALPRMIAAFQGTPNADLLAPLMVTLPGLTAALLSPFAGVLADRYGRRLPLLISMTFFTALGVLPFWLDNLYAIAAARLGLGAALTFMLVISTALLVDYFAEDERRTWLTAQGILLPLLAAGALWGVGMLGALDWRYTFLTYAAFIPVLIAAVLFCYEPPRVAHDAAESQASVPFPWSPVLVVCLFAALLGLFFFGFIIYSGLVFASVGVTDPAAVGAIVGAVSLLTMIGAVIFNLLSRKVPAEIITAVQLLLMGLGYIGIALAPDRNAMIAAGAVHQVGAGMMVATTIFWMSQVAPPEHRGRAFGLLTTAGFLGQFVAPLVIHLTETLRGGLRPGFVVYGALAILIGLAAALLRRPRAAAAPAE